jgi:outer membrane lipoprotein SlyB
MKNTLMATAALLAALNLSGCVISLAGGGYHADQGDLVSRDGTVRYVGWCSVHTHNSRCLDTTTPAPLQSVTVALAPPVEVEPVR